MRIFIDTNIYLDFYRTAHNPMRVFDEIAARPKWIVVTSQTVREVRRNRAVLLRGLIDNIKKSLTVKPYTAALIMTLQDYKAMIAARDDMAVAAKKVVEAIEGWLAEPKDDPVFAKFEGMLRSGEILWLQDSDAIFERAQRRKLLGEPPTSAERMTIGDEIIWETLLAGCKEDLIFVSNDDTYHTHAGLLSEQYNSRTGFSIRIIRELNEALTRVGDASLLIEQEEKRRAEEIASRAVSDPPEIWSISGPGRTGDQCSVCGALLEPETLVRADGFTAHWLECPRCGHTQW